MKVKKQQIVLNFVPHKMVNRELNERKHFKITGNL